MKLRKINAVCSLISTILLLIHAISIAAWMLSQGRIPEVASAIPRTLTMIFIVHVIISIILMITSRKGSKGRKSKEYAKLNAATVVQRISGVLMIFFTAWHILWAARIIHTPRVIHAIHPPLFFILVLIHIAVSTSKAFITLGIGNAKFIKYSDIVIKIICAVTLMADIIGFYLYIC